MILLKGIRTYVNNAENRQSNRVGQPYGKQGQEPAPKRTGKKEEGGSGEQGRKTEANHLKYIKDALAEGKDTKTIVQRLGKMGVKEDDAMAAIQQAGGKGGKSAAKKTSQEHASAASDEQLKLYTKEGKDDKLKKVAEKELAKRKEANIKNRAEGPSEEDLKQIISEAKDPELVELAQAVLSKRAIEDEKEQVAVDQGGVHEAEWTKINTFLDGSDFSDLEKQAGEHTDSNTKAMFNHVFNSVKLAKEHAKANDMEKLATAASHIEFYAKKLNARLEEAGLNANTALTIEEKATRFNNYLDFLSGHKEPDTTQKGLNFEIIGGFDTPPKIETFSKAGIMVTHGGYLTAQEVKVYGTQIAAIAGKTHKTEVEQDIVKAGSKNISQLQAKKIWVNRAGKMYQQTVYVKPGDKTGGRNMLASVPKDSLEGSFKHHRMMAGYHGIREKEIWDEQQDLKSSSDPKVRKWADEKEAERKHHEKLNAHHGTKARQHHDPQKHGSWNDSIPDQDEAIAYGTHHLTKRRNPKATQGGKKKVIPSGKSKPIVSRLKQVTDKHGNKWNIMGKTDDGFILKDDRGEMETYTQNEMEEIVDPNFSHDGKTFARTNIKKFTYNNGKSRGEILGKDDGEFVVRLLNDNIITTYSASEMKGMGAKISKGLQLRRTTI